MWRDRAVPIVATAALTLLGATAPVGSAMAVRGDVGPMGIVDISEVSYTGRWVLGAVPLGSEGIVVLDRWTLTRTPVEVAGWEFLGFVRDNPKFQLTRRNGHTTGVFLTNTATHVRRRIDTGSNGAALKPSWTGTCSDECDDTANPDVFISNESLSKDGRKVAFCANYVTRTKPMLYVKDLKTGRLTRTSLTCGVRSYETDHVAPPQISDDGHVVHVQGDWSWWPKGFTTHWTADSLYFTDTGRTRTVKGWGSMTRDGGTLFMRVGLCPPGTTDATGGRVGAYNVRTKKTAKLPGDGQIYGTDVLDAHEGVSFSAFDQASRRGRFVAGPTVVVDRTNGITVGITAILTSYGYQPYTGGEGGYYENARRRISGDGKVIIAPVGTHFSNDSGSGWTQRQDVAVTGWEPLVQVTSRANSHSSKLVVDIDPDRGKGSWTFRVQKAGQPGPWRTLKKVYLTRGAQETRTIDLPPGTYRVKVTAQHGYQGATSNEVVLTK